MTAVQVKTWTIKNFIDYIDDNSLDVDPDIQRRLVWKEEEKQLLIDSIGREIPMGAITLFMEVVGEKELKFYEVIDGKQRLTTISAYRKGEIVVLKDVIDKSELAEVSGINQHLAEPYYGKKWRELDPDEVRRFNHYEVPVFIVSGDRSRAVQAFTRMNKETASLKPQELRGAVFRQASFLAEVRRICAEFTKSYGDPSIESGFLELGKITQVTNQLFKRMADEQLVSELLHLALKGPQARTDDLNDVYEEYHRPSRRLLTKLSSAGQKLIKVLDQVKDMAGDKQLAEIHFYDIHDFYSFVGYLLDLNMTKPQRNLYLDEIADLVSEYLRLVTEYLAEFTMGTLEEDVYPELVSRYATLRTQGQGSSKKRRTNRIKLWEELLGDVMVPRADQKFSEGARKLIWARSRDKKCMSEDCKFPGERVVWEQGTPKSFDAGHDDDAALGGPARVENGRVEHRRCNRGAI